jgi:hypothetical protein
MHSSEFQLGRSAHCRNWASAQIWGAATAGNYLCIPGLGSDFLLVMVGLSDQSWLYLFDALALVGYWFASEIILCQG